MALLVTNFITHLRTSIKFENWLQLHHPYLIWVNDFIGAQTKMSGGQESQGPW